MDNEEHTFSNLEYIYEKIWFLHKSYILGFVEISCILFSQKHTKSLSDSDFALRAFS